MQKILLILLILLGVTTTTKAEMKNRKKTSLIIVHHSNTENGNVKIFRRFHKEEKKWDDIGYHFVVTNGKGGPDGEIQKGRETKKQGAHAKNRNYNSVGICLVGNDDFTEKQKEAVIWLITGLCLKYQIEPSEKTIQPHHEKCPGSGLNLSEIIKEVKKRIRLFL
jgi:N-acetyl-anhydromuramyl-L-alanine amidase AmpD